MKNLEQKVVNILKENNQEHLVLWLNQLSENQKEIAVKKILEIDFNQLQFLFDQTKKKIKIEENTISHIKYIDKSKLNSDEQKEYEEIGKSVIKSGKYAVVTMAGGQGTRLGHKGPKGTFAINIEGKSKYLFEIIVDSLKKAKEEYQVDIPWYIMTSEENNKQTVDFLEENNYFGYAKESVYFFKQGQLPLLNTDGQLLINENNEIKEASDGNGSIYQSMKKHGVIDDMRNKGIEWIFVGGVDNILLKIVDPILVGITIKQGNQIASKSIVKRTPKEKAGVFCKINGKPKVIEYTELPEQMAEARDENGELVYGEMNILSHMFSITALEELSTKKLPYHVAFKKANYRNSNGELVEVTKPNSYKFEAFIFDAFEHYNDMSILRVKREDEFAPIKNAKDVDCPETATRLYIDFQKRFEK